MGSVSNKDDDKLWDDDWPEDDVAPEPTKPPKSKKKLKKGYIFSRETFLF